jgi:hypothetical protein
MMMMYIEKIVHNEAAKLVGQAQSSKIIWRPWRQQGI